MAAKKKTSAKKTSAPVKTKNKKASGKTANKTTAKPTTKKAAALKTTSKTARKAAPKTAPKAAAAKASAPKAAAKTAAAKTATAKVSSAKASAMAFAKNLPQAITPLDDRLIVAPEVMAEKTDGGIFIPGTVAGRPSKGIVLATGRGRRNKKGQLRPLDVNVGDEIMFAEYSTTKITVQGQDVLILREEDVLGVVTGV